MQSCAIRHACFVFVCLFVCFGGKVTGMDMVGKIILLVYPGWRQSVRSHFPIDHTSVRLTQARQNYTTRPGDQEKDI